jgi:hypothetical protein
MKKIHLISNPRNLSTALMYSFAQRPDTTVVDEPLYAYYLSKVVVDHPGQAEVLQSQSNRAEEVIKTIFEGVYDKEVLFIKNMTAHLVDLDFSFLESLTNVLYIRNPKQILASFARVVETPTAWQIGTLRQAAIFDYLSQKGQPPIVLDSSELLNNPKAVLQQLCAACAIPFYEDMLQWEAGPRPEDGVWAKYWYANVHQTTGFKKQATSEHPLPAHLEPLYEELRPAYERLYPHRITPTIAN